MGRKLFATAIALSFVAAACGTGDSDDATDTPVTTEEAMEESAAETGPNAPSRIAADNQSGDGTTITVASINLPTDGFVVIHADNGGSPGPILGWSDRLPAGDSSDVVVTLNTPLDADTKVFPMAHVDANANGVYEFMPPDVVTDGPAMTADGKVAVVAIDYTIG